MRAAFTLLLTAAPLSAARRVLREEDLNFGLDAFNRNMEDTVIPGWLLTLDESMAAWRGQVGERDPVKIPGSRG